MNVQSSAIARSLFHALLEDGLRAVPSDVKLRARLCEGVAHQCFGSSWALLPHFEEEPPDLLEFV